MLKNFPIPQRKALVNKPLEALLLSALRLTATLPHRVHIPDTRMHCFLRVGASQEALLPEELACWDYWAWEKVARTNLSPAVAEVL